MRTYYLYLPGGFPAIVNAEEKHLYERHPLIGIYSDPLELIRAYDWACEQALERIRKTGRPNCTHTSGTYRSLTRRNTRGAVLAQRGKNRLLGQ